MSSLLREFAIDTGKPATAFRRYAKPTPSGQSYRYRAGVKALAAEHGYHTASTAAELLGVTPQCVARWCRKGALKAFQPLHEWWIDPDDLRMFALARGYPDPLGVYESAPQYSRPYFCSPHYIQRFQQRVVWSTPHRIITQTQAALQALDYGYRGWVEARIIDHIVILRVEDGLGGDWPTIATCYSEHIWRAKQRRRPGRFEALSILPEQRIA